MLIMAINWWGAAAMWEPPGSFVSFLTLTSETRCKSGMALWNSNGSVCKCLGRIWDFDLVQDHCRNFVRKDICQRILPGERCWLWNGSGVLSSLQVRGGGFWGVVLVVGCRTLPQGPALGLCLFLFYFCVWAKRRFQPWHCSSAPGLERSSLGTGIVPAQIQARVQAALRLFQYSKYLYSFNHSAWSCKGNRAVICKEHASGSGNSPAPTPCLCKRLIDSNRLLAVAFAKFCWVLI